MCRNWNCWIPLVMWGVLVMTAVAADDAELALVKAVYRTERVTRTDYGYHVSTTNNTTVLLQRTAARERWRVTELRPTPGLPELFDARRRVARTAHRPADGR